MRQGIRAQRSKSVSKAIIATIESLEQRRLLSGQAPVAKVDTFSLNEDEQFSISPGQTSLFVNGNGNTVNGVHTFTEADGHFSASGNSNFLTISFDQGDFFSDYFASFGAPSGQQLAAGETFTGTVAQNFGSDQAVLSVGSGGNSPDFNETGQFTVLQANFDANGNVTNFAASFNQGNGDPIGMVEYHYLAPGLKSGVLANDTDADSTNLTAKLATGPSHGLLFFNSDGTFQYAPFQNYNGTDSFTYIASDGVNNSAAAKVTLNIAPVDDAPTFVAGPDVTINEDAGPQTIKHWATKISAGGPDEAGQQLVFNINDSTNSALFDVEPSINVATGDLTFTPKKGVYGSADIGVELDQVDGANVPGGTGPLQFGIFINKVNHKPVAVNDAFTTPVNTKLVISPKASETSLSLVDEDGSHFYTQADGQFDFSPFFNTEFSFAIGNNGDDVTQLNFGAPAGKDLVPGQYNNANSTGDPDSPFLHLEGLGDPDDYQIGQFTILQNRSDNTGNRFAASFSVSPATDPDTVVSGTVKFDYAPSAGAQANDSDPDNDALTAKIVTGPTHGTVAMNPDGTFTYTPNKGFSGVDQFTYRDSDGHLNSNNATVKITVSGAAKGQISGTVFDDLNGNGKKESGDFGLLGQTVWIDKNKNGILDKGEVSTTVDGGGHYAFSNLAAGSYRIRTIPRTGWRRTTAKDFYDITLATAGTSANNNFGYTPNVLISGTVFNDADGNGKKGTSEAGLSGIRVFIDNDGDNSFDQFEDPYTFTDSSGNWSFTGLGAGDYTVAVVPRAGYFVTTPPSTEIQISLGLGESSTGNLFGQKKIS